LRARRRDKDRERGRKEKERERERERKREREREKEREREREREREEKRKRREKERDIRMSFTCAVSPNEPKGNFAIRSSSFSKNVFTFWQISVRKLCKRSTVFLV
jgi:hypothetical protein